MADLRIKRAAPADAATVALLGRITFDETFGPLFGRHRSDLRDYLDTTFGVSKIEHSLGKPRNTYWLATLDRVPVGYAKLTYPSSPPAYEGPAAAQLQKIYVLQAHLEKQVGAALMQAVLQEAARRTRLLWLDVLQENTRAIRFYERFGFHAMGADTYTIGAQTFSFHLMGRLQP